MPFVPISYNVDFIFGVLKMNTPADDINFMIIFDIIETNFVYKSKKVFLN